MPEAHLLATAIAIGFGSNFDNLGVGVAYGTLGRVIPHWVNAVINGIGLVFVTAGAFVGEAIARVMPAHTASLLAGMLLIGIGLYYWYANYLHRHVGGRDLPLRAPGWHAAIVLGFALSATNLVNGMGATLISPALLWPTIVSVTMVGYAMIWIGNLLARHLLVRLLGRAAPFVAGLLLVGVGVHALA
ncbi:MAG: manganese efflux pump MntP family protein [Thermomonas sp.]